MNNSYVNKVRSAAANEQSTDVPPSEAYISSPSTAENLMKSF